MQKTIQNDVRVEGVGLHTGCDVSVVLRPAPVNTGVVFRRVDLQDFEIEAQRRWVSRVVLATTLMKRGVMLSTVEHLLSAVYGYGIDNLYVDIDSLEVPILDGSALPFAAMLDDAGVVEQSEARTFLVVEETIELKEPGKFISIEPSDRFSILYEIDFDHPAIGRQTLDLEITSETYRDEIAFARTFGFFREVEDLLKKGLIRGGSFDNAVVLGDDGIMNGELRREDEFVRHKVLDLIGDISLCGYPLIGRVHAYRAGHSLHTNLATEISRNKTSVRKVPECELVEFVRAVNQ
ncbi:MAG: UDP-3-O-acyl-N-acetylglucosamine deacetylase [Acidobacteriota bacterium]|nr:MAG: UDP-3-O-acyl-N-acetylglucosamine deacetylase [Acidobacteriota bacterium]